MREWKREACRKEGGDETKDDRKSDVEMEEEM